MSNNGNILRIEAIAHAQWSSFSGSNLLKTNLSVCKIGLSYLLDLSTVLKYTKVRVMDANNGTKESVCVHSKSRLAV